MPEPWVIRYLLTMNVSAGGAQFGVVRTAVILPSRGAVASCWFICIGRPFTYRTPRGGIREVLRAVLDGPVRPMKLDVNIARKTGIFVPAR